MQKPYVIRAEKRPFIEPDNPEPKKEEKHIILSTPSFLTILLIVGSAIGGAFYFGDRMGSNKFDTEKINMHDSIYTLNQEIKAANQRFTNYKDSLEDAEMIKQVDDAVTHDMHPIPAWEEFKKKYQRRRI